MPMSEPFVPRPPRVPIPSSLLRLYRGDALFRSSTDFATIGLAVYLFVAPPLFDWVVFARGAGTATSTSAGGVPTAPMTPSGIRQAADPRASKANYSDSKVQRQWFTLSDPAIVPALQRAAGEIENGSGAAALATLVAIGRPDDPNVLHLSGYAHVLMRDKEGMSRAYEAQLRAAEVGDPQAMDQVGQFLRLGTAR